MHSRPRPMAEQLEEVLEDLGLAQYHESFVDQGFDTWETILDITESDLDALGVKLGHRRKLQRRIANFRGIAPDVALVSPTRPTVEDAPRLEGAASKHEAPNYNLDSRGAVPGVLAKRKYRRHPKPDDSAPERPPSAYVLFSNKMREELKGRNLSFTEIAKLVGEKWQGLSPAEREPFETQAQVAKDKYNHDLAEYKKTQEYKKYMAYLQEFKAKHSNQTQDKDAFKRIKLSDFGSSSQSPNGAGSASPPASAQQQPPSQRPGSAAAHGSRSDSESVHENDVSQPEDSRKRRVGSTVSISDSHYSASPTPGSTHSPRQHSASDTHLHRAAPPRLSSMSPREAVSNQPPRHAEHAHGSHGTHGSHVSLPSLSDMFDNRQLSPNGHPPTATPVETGPVYPTRPVSASGGAGGASPGLPPHPMAASNSNVSNGSASSYSNSSFPRTPLEGSLPIHALLSGKPASPASPQPASVPPHDHVVSPPHASPPPAWSYSRAPIDHQPAYTEHGASTMARPASAVPSYQYRT